MKIKMKRINGNETIEFIAFNIDGEGSSVALLDDGKSLSLYSKKETLDILFGELNKNPKYELLSVE